MDHFALKIAGIIVIAIVFTIIGYFSENGIKRRKEEEAPEENENDQE